VKNAAMAVINDVGDPGDIHPKRKKPVGERLALAARALAYGEKVGYTGPVYDALDVKEGKAVVSFKNTGGGLEAKGGEPTGFTVAGKDRKWHNAKAEIKDGKVVVWSDEVKEPVAVRFGWANYPVVNLFGKDGLPASAFRTDDFPLITQPKK
jgi:sialate O-acetylesterase